jgi:HSP20 family protein
MNGQNPNDAAVDASGKGEEYLFEFDLHGLTQEEIHISLNEDALYLTGVRTTLSHGGSGLRTERPSGAFVQRLVLPPDSRVNEIQATLQDGILQVHVPKKAPEDESEKPFIVHSEEPKYEHTPS